MAGALYGTNSKEQDAVQEAWTKVGVVIAASQPTIAFVRGPATEPLDGSAAALRRQLQQTAEQIQRMITALDANR